MSGETFTLTELPSKCGIDSWVEALAFLDDFWGHLIEGYKDDRQECPAEYEEEFTAFADKYEFRFDRYGNIVSHKEIN